MTTTILHESDADLAVLAGKQVAVVGYGNQGRPWALNLPRLGTRGAGVRARRRDTGEGDRRRLRSLRHRGCFNCRRALPARAGRHHPDTRGSSLAPDALVLVASGYTLAFDRFDPACDVGMVAPRMLGPEVRRCYEEGSGFITAFGVHRDRTGQARERTLALAKAIGGLRQGAIELTPMQEAVLDLAVEQALSPALRHVSQSFVRVMLDRGIPLEAVLTELFLSGEVERTYRLLREEGYAAQMEHHSPVSQYGQLSRAHRYDHLDVVATMADIVDNIADGSFAQEWDDERDAGGVTFDRLKREAAGPDVAAFEQEIRRQLGQLTAVSARRKFERTCDLVCAVELHGCSLALFPFGTSVPGSCSLRVSRR